ncbi:MAG: PHP domain-containing protein [Chitinivibrionales bacterium]
MLLDMHCHTYPKSMCSRILPVALVRRAVKAGLDGLVITEHHSLWSPEDLDGLRKKAVVPKSFVLLSAQEVETELGHVLVYGAGHTISRKTTLDRIKTLFPDAFLVWAHPWRDGRIPSPEQLQHPQLDGIEILNGNQSIVENYRGVSAWHTYRFKAIGGSDIHSKKRVATFPTLFDHPVTDLQSLVGQLHEGCARPLIVEQRRQIAHGVRIQLQLGTRPQKKSTSCVVKHINDGDAAWESAKQKAQIVERIRKSGFDDGYVRIPKIVGVDDLQSAIFEENLQGKTLLLLLPAVSFSMRRLLLNETVDWLITFHSINHTFTSVGATRDQEKAFFRRCRDVLETIPHRYRVRFRDALGFVEQSESMAFDRRGGTDTFVQIHGSFAPQNVLIGYGSPFSRQPSYIAAVNCEQTVVWDPAFDIANLIAHLRYRFWKDRDLLADADYDAMTDRWAQGLSIRQDDSLVHRIHMYTLRANMGIVRDMIMDGVNTSSSQFKWVMKRVFTDYKAISQR